MLDKVLPTVIAMGYFDSVHLGHQRVIQRARKLADENGASLTVFTFLGNVKDVLNGRKESSVYLPAEREKIIKDLGADHVYFAPTTREFLSLDKKVFLDDLNQKFNIVGYVSGFDYTFGAFGKGNTTYLNEYAKAKGQMHVVVDTLNVEGEKVSTTLIKSLLQNGDIQKVNRLLGRNYSICGKVIKDRQVGNQLGFPTANLLIDSQKFAIKNGVYSGVVEVDGKPYKSIINYGARPTFDLDKNLVEAHLIGFDGDLYSRQIEVQFLSYMRDIQKFDSAQKLKEQLEADKQKIKGENND
ncbi:MAG: riboflavin biosynthesis protein RibF [Clostridia bacterium]|nr:riboflavin biosynthesis protein RibF [Clostridia bacterium]